jgi:glycosyltransferase involved in cell wall biosynthesis
MITQNRERDTWCTDVDAFIALTDHSRRKLVAGGLPLDRIFIKPNFVSADKQPAGAPSASRRVVFAGRLSSEKGLSDLLNAWAAIHPRKGEQLLIAGDGPERQALEKQKDALGLTENQVAFLGYRSNAEVREFLRGARFAVLPSLCYENFPNLVAESFCAGRALIVSDIGALGELVDHGQTGLRCPPKDSTTWGCALRKLLDDDTQADRMGSNAQAEFLNKYTPETNYRLLCQIYKFAIERMGKPVHGEPKQAQSGGSHARAGHSA